MANILPQDEGSVSGIETFPATPEGLSCVAPYRQHICSLLDKSPGQAVPFSGRHSRSCSEDREVPVFESSLYSRTCKLGGRYLVEAGVEAHGLHPQVVELVWQVWPSRSGTV